MAGDVFTLLVIDCKILDRIVARARVGPCAARGCIKGKAVGKSLHQYIRPAGERLAVKHLTGALGDDSDTAVIGPVSVCRVGGKIIGSAGKIQAGVLEPVLQSGVVLNLFAGRFENIIEVHFIDFRSHISFSVCIGIQQGGLLSARDLETDVFAGLILIVHLDVSFQDADHGDKAALAIGGLHDRLFQGGEGGTLCSLPICSLLC